MAAINGATENKNKAAAAAVFWREKMAIANAKDRPTPPTIPGRPDFFIMIIGLLGLRKYKITETGKIIEIERYKRICQVVASSISLTAKAIRDHIIPAVIAISTLVR